MANFPPRAGSGNQPGSQPSSGQPAAGPVPPAGRAVIPTAPPTDPATGAVSGMRTAGVRPCPSCGTLVNVHATVCPNCGEQIAAKEKMVRCRRCRQRASSNLVLCPHCGRELQPAASRWLTWGLPLLAVLLLSGALVLRAGRGDPAAWTQVQLDRVVRLVQALGNRLQPDVTISMIPAGQDPNDPLVSQAVQAGVLNAAPPAGQAETLDAAAISSGAGDAATATPTPAAAAAPAAPATPAEAAPVEQAAAAPPATATQEPASTPTSAAISTATGTATSTAAPTATSTTAATPSAVPSATSSASPGATSAVVRTAAGAAISATLTGTLSTRNAPTRSAGAAVLSPTLASAATPAAALLGLPTPTPLADAPPAAPASAPAPVATPTPTPLAVYEVRRGDTLFEIATQYDVAVEDLLAANGLTEDDVYTIQPGDELKIPAPTPEGGPPVSSPASSAEANAATATPALATYTVRPGDTILAIALRNGVEVEEMLAANGMTINDARTLQPGDELIIPGPQGIPSATLTATPAATPTATVVAATPAVAAAPSATPANVARLDAPRLRSPENGTAVSCSGLGVLTWLQVPSAQPTDLYLVHLGYVNSGAGAGQEEIIWVISQQRPISATSWQLDNDLCGLAPNTAGKQWRWYVEVVEPAVDGLRPVSPASPVWGFTWQ